MIGPSLWLDAPCGWLGVGSCLRPWDWLGQPPSVLKASRTSPGGLTPTGLCQPQTLKDFWEAQNDAWATVPTGTVCGTHGCVAHMGGLTYLEIGLAMYLRGGFIPCVLPVGCCRLYCCCSSWVQGSALLTEGPSWKTSLCRLHGEETRRGES